MSTERALSDDRIAQLIGVYRDGSLLDDGKGVWQQGRATWLLGELYNTVEPRDEWLRWCWHGVQFLDRCCFDPADGRMWFHLTRDGRPIRKRRYAFTESFACIAYDEYAQAAGHPAEVHRRAADEVDRVSDDCDSRLLSDTKERKRPLTVHGGLFRFSRRRGDPTWKTLFRRENGTVPFNTYYNEDPRDERQTA